MFFERELLKRIPQYREEGILDAASAERLTARLRESSGGERSFFVRAIYVAGLVLLLTSACLFVRNVWDDLSVSTRLAFAFVPLLLSAMYSVGVILKNGEVAFKEMAAIATASSFCVMLCVIAKVLNLPENTHGFLVVSMLFGATMMWVFRSYIVAGVLSITLAVFSYGGYFEYIDLPLILILFALLLIFTFHDWRNAKVLQMLAGFVVLITFCASIYGIVDNFVKYPLIGSHLIEQLPYRFSILYLCLVYGVCAILLLFASRGRFANLRFWQMPQLYVGIYSMCAASCVMGFTKYDGISYCGVVGDVWKMSPDSVYIFGCLLALTLIAYVAVFVWTCFAKKKNWGVIILSMMFPWASIYFFTPDFRFSIMILSNILLFASGAAFAFSGLKKRDYLWLNIGVGIFIWQGVMRMLVDDWNMVFRAVFFGVCGLTLIAVNYFINRQKKADDEN